MIPVSICGEFQRTNANLRRTPTVTLKVNTIVPLRNVFRGFVNNLFKNGRMFVSSSIGQTLVCLFLRMTFFFFQLT